MKRFIASVLMSTVVMFSVSYLWHGVILNDFEAIPYSFELFMSLCILVYLGVAVLLTYIFSHLQIKDNKLIKRMAIGGIVGFFIYLIAFTLGVSFQGGGMTHTIVDFSWQMFEQAIGAMVINAVFVVFYRHAKLKGEDPDEALA